MTPTQHAALDPTSPSTSLLTDMYELTMLQGALHSGAAERASVFELFGRCLPSSRRFGVVAGTGRLLEAIEEFVFTGAQIDFLRTAGIVDDTTLDYLREYRFSGTIRGYAEGRGRYMDRSPRSASDAGASCLAGRRSIIHAVRCGRRARGDGSARRARPR